MKWVKLQYLRCLYGAIFKIQSRPDPGPQTPLVNERRTSKLISGAHCALKRLNTVQNVNVVMINLMTDLYL